VHPRLSQVDREVLKLLLDSEGRTSTDELSKRLKVSIDTIRKVRKRLEKAFLIKDYSLNPTRFGWRRIDLLICTSAGATKKIGKALLARKEVTFAGKMIGKPLIDLRVEVFVKDNGELLDIIEKVKSMKEVKDVVWTEVVEVIGRKNLRIMV
jgi:DNA-binding Lrp family transcriptional regulator